MLLYRIANTIGEFQWKRSCVEFKDNNINIIFKGPVIKVMLGATTEMFWSETLISKYLALITDETGITHVSNYFPKQPNRCIAL